jgi:hypothetical protein
MAACHTWQAGGGLSYVVDRAAAMGSWDGGPWAELDTPS